LCGAERDRCISRRHCQLYFDAPLVRVVDLNSSNGTYINGLKPGQQKDEPAADWFQPDIALGVMHDGDILNLGGISVQVDLMECPPSPEENTGLWKDNETVKRNCAVKC
jgi:pSer/pThr/pTyr-binding forkhead associated (FHA) protein